MRQRSIFSCSQSGAALECSRKIEVISKRPCCKLRKLQTSTKSMIRFLTRTDQFPRNPQSIKSLGSSRLAHCPRSPNSPEWVAAPCGRWTKEALLGQSNKRLGQAKTVATSNKKVFESKPFKNSCIFRATSHGISWPLSKTWSKSMPRMRCPVNATEMLPYHLHTRRCTASEALGTKAENNLSPARPQSLQSK